MESSLLMNLVNVVLCLAGLIMCLCRARVMSARTTKPVIRYGYTLEVVVLLASMFGPTYAGGVIWPQLILGVGIVARLWIGMGAWRSGQPAHATRQGVPA
jgi:hypothetical protein